MALKAVLFDFGDTLVSTRLDWRRVVPASLAGLADALRFDLAGVDLDRLGRDLLFVRSAAREQAGRELIEVPATEALARAIAIQGVAGLSDELLQAGIQGFFAPEEKAYPIIFGMPEVLAQLREMDLKLAVVSNATCGRLVRRALDRRGLLVCFDHVAVSADLGPRKPDPAIFLGAANALEVDARDCAHAGDLLDIDVEGARRAGMRAVLCDFLGDRVEVPPRGPLPDAVVRQPVELIELVRTWRSA